MSTLFIVGAGGHGASVAEICQLSGLWSELIFIDDNYKDGKKTLGLDVKADFNSFFKRSSNETKVIVAIGNNKVRKEKIDELCSRGCKLITVIHPSAIISPSATILAGTAIMAGAIVGTEAQVGLSCILNVNSVADHHCKMSNFSHLGVGVCIAGGAVVEEGAWMKAGDFAGYGEVVPSWKGVIS